jgi:hypothetical protein
VLLEVWQARLHDEHGGQRSLAVCPLDVAVSGLLARRCTES